MANTYDNPLVLDTVEASIFNKTFLVAIKRIAWRAPTTKGDAVVLTDGSDNPIFAKTCEVDGVGFEVLVEHTFDGLKLPTLGSGKLYVYRN